MENLRAGVVNGEQVAGPQTEIARSLTETAGYRIRIADFRTEIVGCQTETEEACQTEIVDCQMLMEEFLLRPEHLNLPLTGACMTCLRLPNLCRMLECLTDLLCPLPAAPLL